MFELELQRFEKDFDLALPEEYRKFLIKHTAEARFRYDHRQPSQSPDSALLWELYPLVPGTPKSQHLAKETEVKRAGKAPLFRIMRLFNVFAREHNLIPGVSQVGGEDIPFDRIDNVFAIGQVNGDCFYLDPADNWSAWLYYHDGGDVKRIASSFSNWIAQAVGENG